MRIGIATPSYSRRSAHTTAPVEYARGLAARDHEVTVFARSVERESADDRIRFVRVGGAEGGPAIRAASFPLAATRAVERDNPDVSLSFGSSLLRPSVVRLPGSYRSWWEVARKEWPVTTVPGVRRALGLHHRIALGFEERVVGRGAPKAVLAAGEWAAEAIRRAYPSVAGRVAVMGDGVDLDRFRFDNDGRARTRARWEVGDRPVLFTLATDLRRKGLATLFEAFRLVREERPDARLIVAGRAPAEDVRALAAQHRVGREMRAIGFVEDLRSAYSAADVLVFPTRFDPWGLPVAESLACGTPAAVSARAGSASIVIPSLSGAHIDDPTDPGIVAGATLAALDIKPDREAVRASVEHLSWDRIVADLEAHLERAAR